jgi:Protein of unknown function (DUF2971)
MIAVQHDRPYRSPNRCHDKRFFYKYVSAAVAKTILATRRLRWSSPLLFNDPFDIAQDFWLNFDEAELLAAIADELAVLIDEGDFSVVPRIPILKAMLSILNRQRNPDVCRQIVEKLRHESSATTIGQMHAFAELKQRWRDFVPTFRILCLPELKDVTSMWLHYTDSYRGIVLEFESVDQLDSAFLVARPVIYQDTPPAIADKQVWARCILGRGEKTYQDLYTEYQYVKTTAWSYEREWRIVSLARSGESGLFADYPFHPRELSGIYFGTRCSKEDQTDILSLLTHGLDHVSAYRARAEGVEAKFTFQRIQ